MAGIGLQAVAGGNHVVPRRVPADRREGPAGSVVQVVLGEEDEAPRPRLREDRRVRDFGT